MSQYQGDTYKILSHILLRRTRFEPELNHSMTFDFECKTYSLINRWRGRQGGLIGRLDDASGMDGLEADMIATFLTLSCLLRLDYSSYLDVVETSQLHAPSAKHVCREDMLACLERNRKK